MGPLINIDDKHDEHGDLWKNIWNSIFLNFPMEKNAHVDKHNQIYLSNDVVIFSFAHGSHSGGLHFGEGPRVPGRWPSPGG